MKTVENSKDEYHGFWLVIAWLAPIGLCIAAFLFVESINDFCLGVMLAATGYQLAHRLRYGVYFD